MRSVPMLLLYVSLALTGCSHAVAEPQSFRVVAEAEAVSELALAALSEAPAAADQDRPADGTCKVCRGSGKVGDGRVFQPCLECDGTGKYTTMAPVPDGLFSLASANAKPKTAASSKTPATKQAATKPAARASGASATSSPGSSSNLVCSGNFCEIVEGQQTLPAAQLYSPGSRLYQRQLQGSPPARWTLFRRR